MDVTYLNTDVLDAIPNPVIIYQPDLKVYMVNEAAITSLGAVNSQKLIGLDISALIHCSDLEKFKKIRAQIASGRIVESPVKLMRSVAGSSKPAAMYLSQFSLIGPSGYHKNNYIIESAMRLEKPFNVDLERNTEIQNLSVLSKNIPGLEMFLVDEKLRVRCKLGKETFNQHWHDDPVESDGIFSYFPPELIDVFTPLLKIAFQQTPVSSEFSFQGDSFSVRMIPYQCWSDEILCVVILQNITDTKITEQKLKNSMKQAEEANKAKDVFMARLSHEIRTPLNAVIGFAEQLKDTRLTRKQSDYVDVVFNSSRHLLAIVDDILVLSKIEAGAIEVEEVPFSVNSIFEEIVKLLEIRIKKKKLGFYYQAELNSKYKVIGDPAKLKQVLINLVSNAIKYTDKGEIRLMAKLVKEDNSTASICFQVKDTGIGIAPGKRETIFKPFQQVDNRLNWKFSGCGLGLTISKDLVQSMGGDLIVESTPGEGSVFSFMLKLKKSDGSVSRTNETTEDTTGKVPSQDLRILFVDDDPVNILLGKVILKKFKIKADFAQSGQQALKYFKPGYYNIIFMDINMPDKNGIEVTRLIREKEKSLVKSKRVSIIAMTANALGSQLLQYLKAGMDAVLLKPYSEENLYQKIARFSQNSFHQHNENWRVQLDKDYKKVNATDLSFLLKVTRGDKEFTLLMLNTFVSNTTKMIRKIKSGIKNNDYTLVGEVAHKLVPSVEQMGFVETSDLLKKIEQKYLKKKDGKKDPELIKKTLNLLQEEVVLIQQKIREMT